MAEQDDQHWFDTLAGRAASDADPAALKEAQAVRRAVLALSADQDAKDLDVEAGAQKLLFRLRREGLDGATKKRSWQTYGAFALAATLVLTVGVVLLQSPPVEDTPIYRGVCKMVRGLFRVLVGRRLAASSVRVAILGNVDDFLRVAQPGVASYRIGDDLDVIVDGVAETFGSPMFRFRFFRRMAVVTYVGSSLVPVQPGSRRLRLGKYRLPDRV